MAQKRKKKMDKSNMSEEFHDWLEQCPVAWSKKYGESVYTFWEEEGSNAWAYRGILPYSDPSAWR